MSNAVINYANVTRAESDLIRKIVERAARMNEFTDRLTLSMDITATHANIQRLRLQELLDADDFNFAHDVFGITRHINRDTITMGGCFAPRFSERS